ncbi:MAG: CvpA family protein [Bacteroidales bacterium]|nr:CvpA family protein [Bacteroidales bacterium]MDY0141767.1 CvpA family protein [Bacteroidales bacterium]
MSIFDVILAIIICYFGYKGYKNGLIKELGSLVALIAGMFIAIRFSDLVNTILINNTSISSKFIPIISFAVIFVAIVVLVLVFSKILDRFIKVIKLNWLNKIGGIVFSLLKTALILGGLFFLILQLNNKIGLFAPELFNKSLLYKPLVNVFEFIFPYLDHLTVYAVS